MALIRDVRTWTAGASRQTLTYPTAPSSTFKTGDFLYLDSNNRLSQGIATAAPYTTQAIVGQAINDAVDQYGNLEPFTTVIPTFPGVYFSLPIIKSTNATGVATMNTNQIGQYCNLYNWGVTGNVNGFPTLDLDNQTNPKAKIVSFTDVPGYPGYFATPGQDPTATPNPSAICEFVGVTTGTYLTN